MRQLSIFKRLTILLIFISFQKLHAQSSVIIGTGTLNTNGSSADPLERYYNYEHFQMVYLASELTAGGMTVGAQITSLGFSVSESASSLVNFSISLGHTTQTVANPYINVTGLTTVKNSFTYSPVAQTVGNFDMITFDTPFIWDGTSNIVVNTCTGSNSFTSPYGGVRYTATSTTGSMRFIRTDATSNCNAATNTNSVNRPNIKFNFNANNTPCTGAPNAFTLLSSATSVCPNSTFTLSVQNPPTEAGISYQWQSKPIGSGTFTTIANAPATSIYTVTAVDGISIPAEYTVIAICANSGQSTGSSNSVAVTMNSLLNCYCIPSSTDCTAGDHITNVSFQSAINPINNTTGACLDNTYSDYTSTVTMAEATQGVSIPISVSVNNGGPEYAGVWIDFNQDGDFDDVGEYISITDADNVAPWIFTGNITIPTNASLGITRIRVRSNYNTAILSSDACVTFAYGETEDYLVNILSGCLSPISVSVTNITQTTADVVWTNASSSTVTNWQIEYGPTGFAQGTGTLQGYFGGVGSMVSMTNNLAGFTCNTTYDMNVRIQCGSNFSPWTATTFTTQSCAPPIAGTCQATYTNPCNNGSIVLDLSGNSNNSYDNYQWEQSPDGVSSWTDIVGATQPTLTMSCPGLKKFIRNKTFNNAGADYSNPIAIYPCDPIVIGFDSIGNVTCQGKENGKFTIMPSGGSGDYICTITSGFGCCEGKSCLGGNCNNNTCQCEPFIILSTGIVSLSNLSAGKYYVKLKDSFSPCEVTDSIVISEPDTVKYMGIYTQTIDENNTIHPSAYKIDVSGGTAPFNTYWNNSSISSDSVLLNSAFDSIQFYTVDANGCIDSGMISNVPPPVSIQIDSVEYSTCFGTNNDGFVHTTISSPYSSIIFPYTIEWGNGNTTENLNNAVVPFHKVPVPEISTAGEGIGGVDVGLKKKSGLPLGFGIKGMKWKYKKLTPEKSKMTWIDETDPWVPAPVLKAPGIILDKGTPPFSYQWQDASTLPYFGPACSNTASYSVAITDALGCTIALNEHDTIPLFVNIKVNSLSCNNNNGELEANVCGGFPPYSYLWSNGNTSNQISNLPVGEFSVTITDALGFVATDTMQTTLSMTLDSITNVKCHGGNDGNIKFGIKGGSGYYDYSFTHLSASPIGCQYTGCGYNSLYQCVNGKCVDITDHSNGNYALLSAGEYELKIIDSVLGCEITDTIVILEPAPIQIATTTNPYIDGSSNNFISVNVIGGASPYSYQWYMLDSNYMATPIVGANANILSNLSCGGYNVKIIDNNGCNFIKQEKVGGWNGTCLGSCQCPFGQRMTGPIYSINYENSNIITSNFIQSQSCGNATYWIDHSSLAKCNTLKNRVAPDGGKFLTVSGNAGLGNFLIESYYVNFTVGEKTFISLPIAPYLDMINNSINPNASITIKINGNVVGGSIFSDLDEDPSTGWGSIGICYEPTIGGDLLFEILVTDANFSFGIDDIVVYRCSPNTPSGPIFLSSNFGYTCPNTAMAHTVDVASDAAPVAIHWWDGLISPYRADLYPGDYPVYAIDSLGIIKHDTIHIYTYPIANFQPTITPVTNFNNGAINLGTNNSIQNYYWSNGMTTQSLQNLGVGTYTVNVVDVYQCYSSHSFFVSNGITDTDNDGLSDMEESSIGSNPNDNDSDDDGVMDGSEINYAMDNDFDGDINALDFDSDNDGIFDGTEMGITVASFATNTNVNHFIPDADPSTTTDMTLADTDGGGIPDGMEDINHNGQIDFGELNPLNPDQDSDGWAESIDCNDTIPGTIIEICGNGLDDNCNGQIDEGCTSPIPCPTSTELYVDSSMASSGNGQSWTSAYKTLSEALNVAHKCPLVEKIYVAKGTYTPMNLPYDMNANQIGIEQMIGQASGNTVVENRDRTFHIRDGLEIYGGYPNGGGTQNIVANPTILSGANVGAILNEHALHVVLMAHSSNWLNVNDTTKLNGVTITGGEASLTGENMVNNNTLYRYFGGGVYTHLGLNSITECNIVYNTALTVGGGVFSLGYSLFNANVIAHNYSTSGGGLFLYFATGQVYNNLIAENNAANGAGLYVYQTNCDIVNNSILKNNATSGGGGIHGYAGSCNFSNNVIWGNTTSAQTNIAGADYYQENGSHVFKNNTLQQAMTNYTFTGSGNYDLGLNATGNIFGQNPDLQNINDLIGVDQLYRTIDDGGIPNNGSICINAGNNNLAANISTMDIIGNTRIQNGIIDLGAYEKNMSLNTMAINLKLFIQGYYLGNSTMTPALVNQGILADPTMTDTITVELNDPSAPYELMHSSKAILYTNGNAIANFPLSAEGNTYLMAIKHRNGIETWSANPISILSGTIYDFTISSSQAYGDNQIEVEPGVYAMFTGDINQDGFIDSFDFPALDTDIFNGVSGVYVNTDLNGDGFVDSFDFPIFDVNSYNGISAITP